MPEHRSCRRFLGKHAFWEKHAFGKRSSTPGTAARCDLVKRSWRKAALLIAGFAWLGAAGFPADFYTWTDERGTVHFSDSLSGVPPRYRDQVLGGRFDAPPQQDETPRRPGRPALKGAETDPDGVRQYTLPYRAAEGNARRIIIDVIFNGRVTAPMIFDTGAFETIIFPSLAQKLGLLAQAQPKLQVSAGGIGGSAPAVRTIIGSMAVGELKSDFVPIKVTQALSTAFDGIIGLDFIADYHIRIDPQKQVVHFREVPPDSPRYGGHDERWWRRYFAEFRRHYTDWERFKTNLVRYLESAPPLYRSEIAAVRRMIAYAARQSGEAERLLDRLHRYASRNGVPIHWRRRAR